LWVTDEQFEKLKAGPSGRGDNKQSAHAVPLKSARHWQPENNQKETRRAIIRRGA
jgi:hypothetical protein